MWRAGARNGGLYSSLGRLQRHADEFERLLAGGRVHHEELPGELIGVDADVFAFKLAGLGDWEALDVLEEPGLAGAHKGLEAGDARAHGHAVVKDALLKREGGARADPLDAGPAPPRGEGLVKGRDVEHVGVELALVKRPVRCVDAGPVPVPQAVAARLGLGEPGGKRCVFKRVAGRAGTTSMSSASDRQGQGKKEELSCSYLLTKASNKAHRLNPKKAMPGSDIIELNDDVGFVVYNTSKDACYIQVMVSMDDGNAVSVLFEKKVAEPSIVGSSSSGSCSRCTSTA
jgi:hypothetical protein